MDEKKKNILILVGSFIFAIILGYSIMYIKKPSVNYENNSVNDTKEEINFSNYLYDIDGDINTSTTAKIISDGSLFLIINNTEYSDTSIKNPESVRVCNTTKDGGYNMIYVLAENKVYYVSDVEYVNRLNTPPKTSKDKKGKVKKTYVDLFDKLDIEDVVAISVISEYDKFSGFKLPTVYLKTSDGKIFVSKLGNEYEILEKE